MSDKTRCAVRGAVHPGALCAKIIVGGVFCGFDGECQHKRTSYQPSSGTVGASFIAGWCGECARDNIDELDYNDRCDIVGRTMAFNVSDPEYPAEWIYDQDGRPCCTAFIPVGDPVPEPRCGHTGDMFGGAA